MLIDTTTFLLHPLRLHLACQMTTTTMRMIIAAAAAAAAVLAGAVAI
jgi:hypothetical protein